MKYREARTALERLSHLLNFSTDDVEGTSHEVAHAILLFGKAFDGCANEVEMRVETMSDAGANRHELCALALQHIGMKVLGVPVPLRTMARWSLSGFRGTNRRSLLSTNDVVRAVQKITPSPRSVRRFVDVVERMHYFAPPKGLR